MLDRLQRAVLLLQTFLLLLITRLGLALLSFQTLRALLEKLSGLWLLRRSTPPNPAATPVTIRRIIWAVEKSARLMPGGAKCLAKALVTQTLLERQGCACEFKIGVAKSAEGALEAHAWIEHQGFILMGNLPDLSRYKSFPPL
ncbi:lasso peptide biosynthesis B2 protein [Lyngbya confervoides]|uniref:Lasso peptide biosynthesis B2 protein n=1 Tax=Lyngbya confervoides BDU141951 TaxID=1574623 RepID=A0ABD4SYT8_9CYAN|nr:lasso peptide biosynthesis B2 protein [Lyngbya confervoides]MCM1981265.1 lasso peptide biosynthesis B2 protein [Lyngbya confervoides BDU141951]